MWVYTTGERIDTASPVVVDGVVYITSGDGKLYALNAATGALIWSQTIDPSGGVNSSPAVADGKIYVGGRSNHKFYCLNQATGDIVWTYTTGGHIQSSPAIADGKVFVGSDDGKVYCFSAVPPVTDANGPYTGHEGSAVIFDGTASYDSDGTIVSYEWDLDSDGLHDDATGATVSNTWDDDYTGNIGLKVTDNDGLTDTDTTTVRVLNVAPTIVSIVAPVDPVKVGTSLTAIATFTDPGVLDTHTATWDWGDGSTSTATVDETDGSGAVSGSHVYDTPGVYTIKLTITDKDGGIGSTRFEYVVVYDPEGGFVKQTFCGKLQRNGRKIILGFLDQKS